MWAFVDSARSLQASSSRLRHSALNPFPPSGPLCLLNTESWAKAGDNTLRVYDLNWTVDQVASLKPKICFTFKAGTTLADFNADPNGFVWGTLFDPEQDCCPTFPAQ